jgi:hypothetical protein
MLTEKELKFIEHWEKNRIVFSSFSSKLKRGMPMALIFSFPILLSLAAVYFFLLIGTLKFPKKPMALFL